MEEAGIPIDYIAGTSMGSIVGGMYALGYIQSTQKWVLLTSTSARQTSPEM